MISKKRTQFKWFILLIFIISVMTTSLKGYISHPLDDETSFSEFEDQSLQNLPVLRIDPVINAIHSGEAPENFDIVPDEIFIHFTDTDKDNFQIIEDKYGIRPIKSYSSLGLALFKDDEFRTARLLMNEPIVKSVWANHVTKLSSDPIEVKSAIKDLSSFVDFNKEVGASALKERGVNGSSVTIAFLDTGVDITGQLQGGDLDDFDENSSTNDYKFFGATSLAFDDPFYYTDFSGRGTWHAGIATGTGYYNETFEGIAPGAKYLSVKVYDPFGLTYYSSLISGVEWAIKNSADIILFSADLPGLPDDPISTAVNEAVDRGVLVITPSGNEGSSYMSISSPGHSLKALTIGAYNSHTGQVADFSSRGPVLFDFRQGIDLVAPGVDLIGTRANIFPPGLMESTTTELLSGSSFGEIVQENYTKASGTGGAAAVVAGCAALLLSEFPQASPEMLRIALTSTAKVLTNDRSAEGHGLVNVEAAHQFLSEYFAPQMVDVFPIPNQAIYTGFVNAPDNLNISEQEDRPTNWTALDTMMSYTTHGIASFLVINQTDFVNATSMHLLLSLWGVGYNEEFHLLPELEVEREFYQSTLQPVGSGFFLRYVGILSNEDIYMVTAIETWSYTDDQEARISAYNFEFTVINRGTSPLQNVTLANICKADLYMTEYDLNGSFSLDNSTDFSLEFANDDTMEYNESELLLSVYDSNQSRTSGEFNNTVLGFKSISHAPEQWEIGSFIDILLDIMNGTPLAQTSNYTQGETDPAFGFIWNLSDVIYPSMSHTFTSQLSIGLGNNTEAAIVSLKQQFEYLDKNCTRGDVIDLQVIEPTFNRVIEVRRKYSTSTNVINVGTMDTNTTEVIFLVNRSNQINRYELFVVVQEVPNVNLFEFFQVEAEWYPIYEDTYTLGWIIAIIQDSETNVTAIAEFAGITDALPEILPTELLSYTPTITSYQSRNSVVIDGEYYSSLAKSLARTSPDELNMAPMIPQFPGDIGMWNVTYISVYSISDVQIAIEGSVSDWVTINDTYYSVLSPYTTIMVNLMVPLMAAPGIYKLNVTFSTNGNKFLVTPLNFIIRGVTGRVWFDSIHNNVSISVSGDEFEFGWDERLDTPYGNFYNFKELWAQPATFDISGTTITPLMTGLEFNLAESGDLDLSAMEDFARFLPDSLKGYSFHGDSFSASTLNMNILQLGDILILSDPEEEYSIDEINNVTTFVEQGGVVLFWVEPENENNWTSINQLISKFGLEINNTPILEDVVIQPDLSLITELDLSLQMSSPVSFKVLDEEEADPRLSIDVINDFMALVNFGRGKACFIGDKDLFNNTGLTQGDNLLFAQELLRWALTDRTTEINTYIENPIVQHGESVYFDVVVENYDDYDELFDEGYIWIYSFVHAETGEEIISSSNLSLPMNPIYPGEYGRFLARFKSEWTNLSGTFFIVLYFDHLALTSRIFFSSFTVLSSFTPSVIPYTYPDIPYEHLFDFLLLTAIVALFFLQRQYRSSKWGRRFRIVELKEASVLYEARTHLAEAEMLGKSLNQALTHSKYNELEQIRFLLRIRKRFTKLFSNVKKFGDKLGEI